MSEPIIVVGTGRCGTSTVARLLIELGVDMGSGFHADPSNPDGFYEDRYIRSLNQSRLAGRTTHEDWSQAILRVAEIHFTRPGRWGWKDPRTAEFMENIVALFPCATYIRCHRNRPDTLASFLKWYSWDESQAGAVIDRRVRNMDKHLPASASNVGLAALLASENAVQDRLRIILGM